MVMLVRLRAMVVALCSASVAGCAGLPDWSLFGPLQSASTVAGTPGFYDFSWSLSGDRQAGPVQIFDDGRQTWLQFGPNQPTPAIFARTEHGDQLLSHRRQGPYFVLDGVWPLLVLRAGRLESRAQRVQDDATAPAEVRSPVEEASSAMVTPQFEAMPPTQASSQAEAHSPAEAVFMAKEIQLQVTQPQVAVASAADKAVPALTDQVAKPGLSKAGISTGADVRVSANANANVNASGSGSVGVGVEANADANAAESGVRAFPLEALSLIQYRVSPDDGNMRLALTRWAATAGWTFESEHWAVDVDIPIAGSAVFELEFAEAVQQLLASTELSERPLQPCFYANKVLRVVAYAQSCDRSAPLERA